jgi:hypothetical protein
MPTMTQLPDDYAASRRELQRIATHVLARARATHGGRFGLRVTASGIGTPPFGPEETVVRIAGATLVVEGQTPDGRAAASSALAGVSLADAASFVGITLDEPFSPGADAPPVGDPDAPLVLGAASVAIALDWYGLGARVLDAVLPHLDGPVAAQLWPEHFDLGSGAGNGGGVNLGASPGDAGGDGPYLYVGPWTDARPGDPEYWNAPFGAVATRADLLATGDPFAAGVAFLLRGLTLLDGD